jgi:hypothetical protein
VSYELRAEKVGAVSCELGWELEEGCRDLVLLPAYPHRAEVDSNPGTLEQQWNSEKQWNSEQMTAEKK